MNYLLQDHVMTVQELVQGSLEINTEWNRVFHICFRQEFKYWKIFSYILWSSYVYCFCNT